MLLILKPHYTTLPFSYVQTPTLNTGQCDLRKFIILWCTTCFVQYH